MTPYRSAVGVFAAVLAPISVAAQDPAADLAAAATQLRAALAKTQKLQSVAFKTVESRDDAFRRQMPGGGGAEDVQVTGNWYAGVTQATVGFDDDQVLFANGRMLARKQDGDWKLRRGSLADGKTLPFVLEPGVLFTVLGDLPESALKVTHVEPGKVKDKDVVIYSVTLSGAHAEELALCGIMPRSAGGGMSFVFAGGGAGMEAPKPEVTLDLALSVDPASGVLTRVHTKAYTKSEMPGNIHVRFAGADGVEIGGDEEAEEEDTKAADASAPLQFSKGLPKRKLDKKTSLTEFDVSLSQHGAVKKPELTDAAKRLLGAQ